RADAVAHFAGCNSWLNVCRVASAAYTRAQAPAASMGSLQGPRLSPLFFRADDAALRGPAPEAHPKCSHACGSSNGERQTTPVLHSANSQTGQKSHLLFRRPSRSCMTELPPKNRSGGIDAE